MAKEKDDQNSDQPPTSVFEIPKIKRLIELMQTHELSEVDLRQADQRIRLRRGSTAPPVLHTAPAIMPAAAPPTPAAAAAPSAAPDNSVTINSPTIGTFYCRPKPDTADFVKVGDIVTPDTIVCLVEAMKMFNEIPAGVSGKIVAVLVKNEEPVDNNKPLFRVAPA